jgi:hypothetical protein
MPRSARAHQQEALGIGNRREPLELGGLDEAGNRVMLARRLRSWSDGRCRAVILHRQRGGLCIANSARAAQASPLVRFCAGELGD